MQPSGLRPSPTDAAAETGRWATSHRDVAAPVGEPSKQPASGLQKAKSRLPLWGRWIRVSEDGEGSPPEACRRPSLASPFGGGGLALARRERAARQRLAEGQVSPPPLGEVPPQGDGEGSPPEACRRPSLASPFGGRWCPVGTVQRLVSAAASVGDGRSPLGCITRAGRRECPRRGRRGQPASGTSPKQSLFALTYRPAVPYNQTTSWGSSLLGLPSGNVNTLANAWYCLKKRDSWKTSI